MCAGEEHDDAAAAAAATATAAAVARVWGKGSYAGLNYSVGG